LSLTVSLKFRSRGTELKASISTAGSPPGRASVVNPPARIVESLGKYFVGEEVELNESQFGPISFAGFALAAAMVMPVFSAESFCSQL
jgi:hypothetical protein